MASENAKNAAKKVLETIGKGKKVNKGKILREVGYSKNTADNPILVESTKSYQKVMKPLLERLEEERDAIIKRLKVTRNKAKYRDLMDGLDKITKNHQLLSGGNTERVLNINISEEIAKKNAINQRTK